MPSNACLVPTTAALRAFEDVAIAQRGRRLYEKLTDTASDGEIMRGLSYALKQYCAVVVESPLGEPVRAILPNEGQVSSSSSGGSTTTDRFGHDPLVVRVVQLKEPEVGWVEVYTQGPHGPIGTVQGSEARALLQKASK